MNRCGLNRYGPHKLKCLNAWPIASGTIRRCGLVGIGMVLMEKLCHCGVSFEVSCAQGMPSVVHSSLPVAY